MIERDYGEYTLTCDVCGDEVGGFDDFYDAVDYKKENRWRSRKDSNGDWEDVCPDCQ